MKFTDLGLSEALLKAVLEEGYSEPTPIQAQAIPAVLEGHDIMASAQTGTGKTAGFTLPLLHKLADMPRIDSRGQARPDAVPTRNDLAGLHPAEHPRDGAQIIESTARRSPTGRARTDVHLAELLDRGRRREVLGEALGLDEAPIGPIRLGRNELHDPIPPGAETLVHPRLAMGEGGLQHGRQRKVEVAPGQPRQAVLVGDHLALLGVLHLAVEYS